MESLSRHTQWLHGAMRLYAGYGVAVFAVLLLVGYLLARHQPDAVHQVAVAVWAALAALVGLLLAQPINHAVARPRPYTVIENHELLVPRTHDLSFPSDHATIAAACAVGLWFVSRRLGLVAGLLALLMAFARVYVGAHYPGDVLGGLALGATVALVGVVPAVAALSVLSGRLARTPLRPLVRASSPG